MTKVRLQLRLHRVTHAQLVAMQSHWQLLGVSKGPSDGKMTPHWSRPATAETQTFISFQISFRHMWCWSQNPFNGPQCSLAGVLHHGLIPELLFIEQGSSQPQKAGKPLCTHDRAFWAIEYGSFHLTVCHVSASNSSCVALSKICSVGNNCSISKGTS